MFKIKRWIDDGEWTRYFSGFEMIEESQRDEIVKGMHQSAAVILLRNWMEVRKLFISYLCTSSDSPYHPCDAIFSRDEYQSEVGNLPHMHMMVSVKKDNLSQSDIDKFNDLVRASVGDIVRGDEIKGLVDSGILNDKWDVYKLQDLASEILAHKCSRRCLKRIGDGDGECSLHQRSQEISNKEIIILPGSISGLPGIILQPCHLHI